MVSIMRKRAETAEVTPQPSSDEAAREPLAQLQDLEKKHNLDPNLPVADLAEVDAVVASGNAEKGAQAEAALAEENSPYPEVSKRQSQPCRQASGMLTQSLARCVPP